MTQDEFRDMLKEKKGAPFLFLGSGFSRHYLGTPQWEGILQQFAPHRLAQYYSKLDTHDLIKVATEIAKDVNESFWQLDDNDEFKRTYQDKILDQSSILKIKISNYLKEQSLKDFPDCYQEEINSLKQICIDGIITTNWDDTAERIFPKYLKYVGQEQLIFSSVFNIGEIYKIHGSMELPQSMVLTESDYEDFNKKNPYLVAKLITIFIEHPVIFLGYSISDKDIQNILRSIVACLNEENILKLQDNLIFVEWDSCESCRFVINRQDIMMEHGIALPVIKIKTHSYREVYELLNYYERKIPANVLREYKKQFYDIIQSEKPDKKLYVLPGNQIDKSKDIEVVYGFGAINQFRSAVGYRGIKAVELFRDVLNDDRKWDPEQVLTGTVAELTKSSPKAFLPIYKYLSQLGINDDEEYKRNKLGVNYTLRKGADFQSYSFFTEQEKHLALNKLLDNNNGMPIWKIIALIPYLCIDEKDLPMLRNFIDKYFSDFLIKKNNYSTHMRKLICFYDWKKFGW